MILFGVRSDLFPSRNCSNLNGFCRVLIQALHRLKHYSCHIVVEPWQSAANRTARAPYLVASHGSLLPMMVVFRYRTIRSRETCSLFEERPRQCPFEREAFNWNRWLSISLALYISLILHMIMSGKSATFQDPALVE